MNGKIILVTGYCATGKTTFSRKLSQKLEVPCFNKDTIKEVIGDGFGIENKDVRAKNSAVTFQLMLHIAEKFLQIGKTCIIESDCGLEESEQINKLLEKYNSDGLTLLFKGDLEILYERYVEREKSGNRHWVHIDETEDKDSFINGHLYFRLGEVKVGKTIQIDATYFDKINYEDLFAAAKNFILLANSSFYYLI
ncbi:hypothetical protein AGMMS50284_5280 [Clostridia bacterium]|nr:hypothetical protein AGMMS50284_5280 [Clostridia bacterium]